MRLPGKNGINVGVSQLASSIMAVKHFNSRDPSVVPRLASLGDCNMTIDMASTSVINTLPPSHISSQRLYNSGGVWPCAGIATVSDHVAVELSAVAQAAQFPLILTEVHDIKPVSNCTSSFSSSVSPDLISSARVVAAFLNYKQRNNFIAMLYEESYRGLEQRQLLTNMLESGGVANEEIHSFAKGFTIETGSESSHAFAAERLSPLDALNAIQQKGFRTIVIAMTYAENKLQAIADAAEQLAMNNGDYFYVWFDQISLGVELIENINVTKLLDGSAVVVPFGSFLLNTSGFSKSWKEQGQDLVDVVNGANPMEPGTAGYMHADDNFFQTVEPGIEACKYLKHIGGSCFSLRSSPMDCSVLMYDAVMSVGIGACDAVMEADGTITGANHHQSIIDLKFEGATGIVGFGSVAEDKRVNSRQMESVTWGAVNRNDGGWTLTDISYAGSDGEWLEVAAFRYADGTTDPPQLLRTPGNQNYISNTVRGLALGLMLVTILGAIASMAWLHRQRIEPLVVSMKTRFLHLMCFGVVVQVSAISCLVVDEGSGLSDKALGSWCVARLWLSFSGFSLQYIGLFAMLWQVHESFQSRDRQIGIKRLVGPMAILQLAMLMVLSIWTGLYPPRWDRKMLNVDTNETIGTCEWSRIGEFGTVLLCIVFTQMAVTAATAFMMRTPQEAFSEGSWILFLVIIQFEIVLVAVPVNLIFDVREDGRVGSIAILWFLSTSTLCFYVLPLILAIRRAKFGIIRSRKRGQIGGVHVSGLAPPQG